MWLAAAICLFEGSCVLNRCARSVSEHRLYTFRQEKAAWLSVEQSFLQIVFGISFIMWLGASLRSLAGKALVLCGVVVYAWKRAPHLQGLEGHKQVWKSVNHPQWPFLCFLRTLLLVLSDHQNIPSTS